MKRSKSRRGRASARSYIGGLAHIGGTLLPPPPDRREQARDMHLLLAIATFVGAVSVGIITNVNILYNVTSDIHDVCKIRLVPTRTYFHEFSTSCRNLDLKDVIK